MTSVRQQTYELFLPAAVSPRYEVFYDAIRPTVQRYLFRFFRVLPRFEKWTSIVEASSILLFLEALLFAVTVLAVLPITARYGKKITTNHPTAMSGYFQTVIFILSTVAWILWTASAIMLVMGVLFGAKLFGLISFSSLLALLAQGIGALGLLAPRCDDDDLASSTTEDKASRSSNDNKNADESSSSQPPKNNSLAVKNRVSSSFDVIIFFVVSTLLLQSPYYLHLLFNCILNYSWELLPERIGRLTKTISDDGVIVAMPVEITATMVFMSTIGIPLFTHGAGGEIIIGNKKGWCFHHPFEGGRLHVTAQAVGWSLLFLAGLLQLSFLVLGVRAQHSYLLHSGTILSSVSQIFVFFSLLSFHPESPPVVPGADGEVRDIRQMSIYDHAYKLCWYILSIIQDLILTNMHWFYGFWITSAMFGFNPFSLDPLAKLFNLPLREAVADTLFVVSAWTLWALIVPYSPKRKIWKWSVFGIINDLFLRFLYHPAGLFSDSKLVHEDPLERYQQPGLMFALAPHGTLPTSVLAVWYQFEHIFGEVCLFAGSQAFLVPGYRYLLAMRGGCMPIEKDRLLNVMETKQSVALVPGGINEMLHCIPHSPDIRVSKKHYGFVRIAIQQGYQLVPTFFFHANDQYDNPMKDFQLFTYKICKIPVGLPWYTNKFRLPVSNRTPIRVALGKVINVEKCPNPSISVIEKGMW